MPLANDDGSDRRGRPFSPGAKRIPVPADVAAASSESALQRDADELVANGAPGVLIESTTSSGNRVRVRSGYGDLEKKTPVPWDAHFRIASFTKTFVSATVLQLVGEARLSLEDTVDRWLPGLVAGNGNDGRAITVRQLLQHTSGLRDYFGDLSELGDEKGFFEHRYDRLSAPDAVKKAVSRRPDFQPGTSWGYSNTNYVLAGMVIEKVTGQSWRHEVRDRIIRPLGLHGTSAPGTSPRIPGPHARGYHRFPVPGTDKPGERVDATSMNQAMGGGADGELISTTEDGNKFLKALMAGEVLRPAQLAEMKKIVRVGETGDDGYGLGLSWTPTSCGGYWGHDGGVHGFLTGNGVTEDGTRSVMISVNTFTLDNIGETDPLATVIEHALCER
ncbi:serine hydrolase domain-containing protein [Amycolatopsis benzoatilytica]|uniref:serine hydrolase domain-containing protein n=1 Tax=Amycolatopsis benzoatilytica TaxID=346045 RepID=UPI00036BC35C|nr:serine hydrolase domain-containing protein [Amycolatopsis benzoatilytica]